MFGLMQHKSLLISSLLDFAERHHGDTEIVSRRVEGDIHRYTWKDAARRAGQVAAALDLENIAPSDRIGTLAWNGYRHLELYFGVSGSARVLHTINPRLHLVQIAWIVNPAEDRILLFDMTFLPLIQEVHERCPSVQKWIALCDVEDLPSDSGIPGLVSYEGWIGQSEAPYVWPDFDENTASGLCYTSGTTGAPKGVLYSHRSSVLHAYGAALPDGMGLSARDCVLPIVPMFHVNAWGVPYIAALAGCKLVLPGPALDGESVYALFEGEAVTFAAGVPTVWQMVLRHLETTGARFSTLRRTMIGGSACPPSMIASLTEHGVEVLHAWGMTETSPLVTVSKPKVKHLKQSPEQQQALRSKQGRAIFGTDIKIVGSDNDDLPWDGTTYGELMVRGPWIVSSYFRNEGDPLVRDKHGNSWFPTGDVATIDPDGYMQITDRTKDLIKSGGEWISSIEIENIATAHPAIALAGCVGVPHPKWDERPIIAVVKKPGAEISREELLEFYADKIAKWQIPDDVVFLESIPLGPTGKVLKMDLREQLRDLKLG